jgi:hypothetical protein
MAQPLASVTDSDGVAVVVFFATDGIAVEMAFAGTTRSGAALQVPVVR